MTESEEQRITDFFHSNMHLFKRPLAMYSKDLKAMNDIKELHWTWGKCFPMSQFLFYYFGGYKSEWILKCIRKLQYSIGDIHSNTSHWYVENSLTGQIVDLSKEQFSGVLNIEDYYFRGRKANYGFPYHRVKGVKIQMQKAVPCKNVLNFYKEYRNIELNPTLEEHYAIINMMQ